MRVDDAVEYFGSTIELAAKLGLKSASTISNWRARNEGQVPELYARQIHDLTRGKVKFDRREYEHEKAS